MEIDFVSLEEVGFVEDPKITYCDREGNIVDIARYGCAPIFAVLRDFEGGVTPVNEISIDNEHWKFPTYPIRIFEET